MIETKETKTFAENLAAIAAGDENATTDLTLDIVPDLLRFAKANGADQPETLVQGILIDAMRNMGRFHGTRGELISVLCRVISRYIAAESKLDDQEMPSGQTLTDAEPLGSKTDLELDDALLIQGGVETVKATGLIIPKPRVNPKSAIPAVSPPNRTNPATAPYRPDIGLRSPGSSSPTFTPPSAGGSTAPKAAATTGYRESLSWSRRFLLLAGLTVLVAPVALIF